MPLAMTCSCSPTLSIILCDPTVDDPLVPEIAATYIEDRQLYEKNARAYTERCAGKDQCWEEYGVTPDMFENGPQPAP